jgi:hypothetical protein
MTEDVVAFFNAETRTNLTPIFNQYLHRAELPTLELAFNDKESTLAYRWNAGERDFAMPVRIGSPARWEIIRPTTSWQIMKWQSSKDQTDVATDLYYIAVTKQ